MKEPFCKHDWVGDEQCAYCALDDAQETIERQRADAEIMRDALTEIGSECPYRQWATIARNALESLPVNQS